MIERMTPGLPRIELFARSRREGWEAWGNQAPLPPQDPDVAAAPEASQSANDAEPRQAIVRPVDAAPVVDDGIIDLPNILRRGAGNGAPWMNNGEAVPTP